MGRQDYHWQHEPILYGWKPGAAHRWFTDRKQATVWNYDRPSRSTDHPTTRRGNRRNPRRLSLVNWAEPLFAAEARKRQAHGQTAPGKSLTAKLPEASKGEAREKAAKAAGTNPHYISDVKVPQLLAAFAGSGGT